MIRCSLALALGLLILVSIRSAQAAPALPLHTAGAFLVDAHGQRVRLQAVNWYGAESSDFVVGGLQTASLQSIVRQIKTLGFNAVRLPWSNQIFESNPTVEARLVAANPALAGLRAMTVFDRVVEALSKAGLLIILDNHNSDAEWCCNNNDGNMLWYNQRYPQAKWIADWKAMAARYQNNPLVVGADLRNEPRQDATWGGPSTTNWQAAAELGGNAVLEVNPRLLIFVEGVDYALDLTGAAKLPVHLKVDHRLVYEAHDYGYDYHRLADYRDYEKRVTAKWGYLEKGSDPYPVWLGEFGTCNNRASCVQSERPGANGRWFGFLSHFVRANQLDWGYWALNGTQSSGSGRHYGEIEGYGVLNGSWTGSALGELTADLQLLGKNQ